MSAPALRVPFRSLSDEQCAAVPRSMPASWLTAGVWIPLAALLVYLLGFAPQRLELGQWQPYLISYSAIVGSIALFWGAGRHAAWIALAAVLSFNYLVSPSGIEKYVIYAAAMYFALLCAASLIGQLRFAALLRSWHREAQGSVDVPVADLNVRRLTKILPSTLWTMAGSSLLLPAARILWQFFTKAGMDPAKIESGLWIEASTGSIVLVVCLLLSGFKWLESRSVPLTVLEFPFDPGAGPLAFTGIGNSIPVEEAEQPRCTCAESTANAEAEALAYPQYRVCDNDCLVHGIRAGNALDRSQFSEIAHETWVYGEHVRQELLPAGTRMSIAGLYGWDAAPVRVADSVYFGRGAQATPANVLPRVAREPLRRARRRMKWVDAKANGLYGGEFTTSKAAVIDPQALDGRGSSLFAIRVEGQRPYLLDAPVQPANGVGAGAAEARRPGAH